MEFKKKLFFFGTGMAQSYCDRLRTKQINLGCVTGGGKIFFS